jgi:hypothetical protein
VRANCVSLGASGPQEVPWLRYGAKYASLHKGTHIDEVEILKLIHRRIGKGAKRPKYWHNWG